MTSLFRYRKILVALDLAVSVKPSQVRLIAILSLLISITFVSLMPLTQNQPETDFTTPLKTNESQVVTHLTATISTDGSQEKISQKPDSSIPIAFPQQLFFEVDLLMLEVDSLI